jgi:hypothetical protein
MAHGLVRARFAERAAHGVVGEAVFRPLPLSSRNRLPRGS